MRGHAAGYREICISTADRLCRHGRVRLRDATANADPDENCDRFDAFRAPASHRGMTRMADHRRRGGEDRDDHQSNGCERGQRSHHEDATDQVVKKKRHGPRRCHRAADGPVVSASRAVGVVDPHINISSQYHLRQGGRESPHRRGRHRPHFAPFGDHGRRRSRRFQHDQSTQGNLHTPHFPAQRSRLIS
jgi:hypothetical protein